MPTGALASMGTNSTIDVIHSLAARRTQQDAMESATEGRTAGRAHRADREVPNTATRPCDSPVGNIRQHSTLSSKTAGTKYEGNSLFAYLIEEAVGLLDSVRVERVPLHDENAHEEQRNANRIYESRDIRAQTQSMSTKE